MVYKQISQSITKQIQSSNKRVKAITVRLIVSNCNGSVYFTDLFLQAGMAVTGWVGHASELKWTING